MWETNRQSPPPYRPKYTDAGESSHYQEIPRRYRDNTEHYQEDRRPEDYPRNDKFSNRNESRSYEYNRHDYSQEYDNRWEQDKSIPRRRPYGPRGGYRNQGSRPPGDSYGDGPSWQQRDSQDDREPDGYPKNRVKLVDY